MRKVKVHVSKILKEKRAQADDLRKSIAKLSNKKVSRKEMKKGIRCPYCGRFVKSYKRSLTSSMATALLLIYRKYKKDSAIFEREPQWIHIEEFLKNSYCPASIRGDVAKLQHWGLLIAKKGLREDGSSRNGYYKITKDGISFCQGTKLVPASITCFNNKVIGVDTKKFVTIHEALRNRFSYDSLMETGNVRKKIK